MQTISLCIPTWNRLELTLNSFDKVYADPRISEVVISDDCSDIDIYEKLESVLRYYPKVRLYRNVTNKDCYENKAVTIAAARNDYCILLDSDNQIDIPNYLDRIYEWEWREDTFLMPCWAKPTFDYRAFSKMGFDRCNVAKFMDEPFFSTMLNCANYFVNRKTYLECYDPTINPHTADSIFINYRLLEMGGSIKVVDGMYYNHLVHDQSHYKLNNHKTGDFYAFVENKLRNMK